MENKITKDDLFIRTYYHSLKVQFYTVVKRDEELKQFHLSRQNDLMKKLSIPEKTKLFNRLLFENLK
ncbi:MAG: hypothetical protein K9G63_15795 [Melioribacteraceae bacterium]|nr:hypothetical protein [Melioribacteraceae bacterium]